MKELIQNTYIKIFKKLIGALVLCSLFIVSVSAQNPVLKQHKNGKYGYQKVDGKWFVRPKWEDAREFVEGKAAVKKGGKWGFLDKNGDKWIKPTYYKVRDFSSGFAAVKPNKNWEYITYTGVVAFSYSMDFDEIIWAGDFHNEVALIRASKFRDKEAKYYSLIDKKGKFIKEFIVSIGDWENERCLISFLSDQTFAKGNTYYVYINNRGEDITPRCGKPFKLGKENVLVENWFGYKMCLDSTGSPIAGSVSKFVDIGKGVSLGFHRYNKTDITYALNKKLQVIVPESTYSKLEFFNATTLLSIDKSTELNQLWSLDGKLLLSSELELIKRGNLLLYKRKGAYGVVDLNLKEVLPPIIENIDIQSSEVILFKKGGKWGIWDNNLKEIISPQYENLVASSENPSFFVFSQQGKKGIINKANKELVTAKYDNISPVSSKPGIFEISENNKINWINTSDKKLLKSNFDAINYDYINDGLLKVQIKDNWGISDLRGQLIVPSNYYKVEFAKPIIIAQDVFKKTVIFDKKGKKISEIDRLNYLFSPKNKLLLLEDDISFKDNIYVIMDTDKQSYSISSHCNNLNANSIKKIEWVNDSIVRLSEESSKGGFYYFDVYKGFLGQKCDTTTRTTSNLFSNKVFGFLRAMTIIPLIVDGFRGKKYDPYANVTTKTKTEISCSAAKYREAGDFFLGRALVKVNHPHDYRKSVYGYINTEGKQVIPTIYLSAKAFSEGLAAVQDPKTEKWGYLNPKGELIIDFQFKEGASFKDGKARVKGEDGIKFLIDSKGEKL
ncbi:MAG: WG repeat-containing protein [Aureispira sp.]|nr:WG repeat-containing protein [Aureispira sp.]